MKEAWSADSTPRAEGTIVQFNENLNEGDPPLSSHSSREDRDLESMETTSTSIAPLDGNVEEDSNGKIKPLPSRKKNTCLDGIRDFFFGFCRGLRDRHDPTKLRGGWWVAKTKKLIGMKWLVYMVFLLLFLLVSFMSMLGSSGHWLSEQIREAFVEEEFPVTSSHILKNFRDIRNADEFWQWVEGPLLTGIYPPASVNGLYEGVVWADNHPLENNLMYGYNKIVGGVQLRQLRVVQDTCDVKELYETVLPHCYDSFSSSISDTSDFGPLKNQSLGLDNSSLPWSAYVHRTASETGGVLWWGFFGMYGGDGFGIILPPNNKSAAGQLLTTLKENAWVDRQTRLVLVEFTVYSPSLDTYSVALLGVEFPYFGGAMPASIVRSINVFRYESAIDFFRLVLEIFFMGFVAYYLYEEFREMQSLGHLYWRDIWNYIDLVNLFLFVIVAVLRLYTVTKAASLDIETNIADDTFINFQPIASAQEVEKILLAVNAFICWFKVFKYIHVINPQMNTLIHTLQKAATPLALFLVMFLIVFLGYAQAGFFAFGMEVAGFRNLGFSIYSLFIAILGDFQFEKFYNVNRIFGPAFFFSFMILMFFILMNMFLAIINEAYEKTKEIDHAKASSDRPLLDELFDKLRGPVKVLRQAGVFRNIRRRKGKVCPEDEYEDEDLQVGVVEDTGEEELDTLASCSFEDNPPVEAEGIHKIDNLSRKNSLLDQHATLNRKLSHQAMLGTAMRNVLGRRTDIRQSSSLILMPDSARGRSEDMTTLSNNLERIYAQLRTLQERVDTLQVSSTPRSEGSEKGNISFWNSGILTNF